MEKNIKAVIEDAKALLNAIECNTVRADEDDENEPYIIQQQYIASEMEDLEKSLKAV